MKIIRLIQAMENKSMVLEQFEIIDFVFYDALVFIAAFLSVMMIGLLIRLTSKIINKCKH